MLVDSTKNPSRAGETFDRLIAMMALSFSASSTQLLCAAVHAFTPAAERGEA
jgi:hypothetical protein